MMGNGQNNGQKQKKKLARTNHSVRNDIRHYLINTLAPGGNKKVTHT